MAPQPPVKKVGDGKERRGEDPERSFQWYTPKKRRATPYEDVTVDTQPSVHGHLDRGWPTHCVALEAAMKQRQAQAYLLYGMDLEEHFGEFPVEAARQSFLEDEHWQPARRYVERLRATPDWGERVVATNVCFEPTVGILIRRELLMRSPRFNGDTVTPAVNHVPEL